jgi:hypothetical protein
LPEFVAGTLCAHPASEPRSYRPFNGKLHRGRNQAVADAKIVRAALRTLKAGCDRARSTTMPFVKLANSCVSLVRRASSARSSFFIHRQRMRLPATWPSRRSLMFQLVGGCSRRSGAERGPEFTGRAFAAGETLKLGVLHLSHMHRHRLYLKCSNVPLVITSSPDTKSLGSTSGRVSSRS